MARTIAIEELRRELLSAEVEAANASNRDMRRFPDQLKALEAKLRDFYEGTLVKQGDHHRSADYRIARRLRRMLMRVVADRYCRALLPHAIRIVDPGSTIIAELAQRATARRDEMIFDGARHRRHRGDRGWIAWAITTLLLDTTGDMFNSLSDAEADILFSHYTRLTEDVKRFAAATSDELFGHPIDTRLLEDPFQEDPRLESVTFRERQLAFFVGKLASSLPDLIKNNTIPGQGEFFAVVLTDLKAAYDDANCPPPTRYPTSLRHLTLLGSVSALTDAAATRLLFGKAGRKNLWVVGRAQDTDPWRIQGASPPLRDNVLAREHKCPGPDALDAALPEDEKLAGLFADKLRAITSCDHDVIDPRAITAASTVAAFAVGVQYHLQKAGLVAGP